MRNGSEENYPECLPPTYEEAMAFSNKYNVNPVSISTSNQIINKQPGIINNTQECSHSNDNGMGNDNTTQNIGTSNNPELVTIGISPRETVNISESSYGNIQKIYNNFLWIFKWVNFKSVLSNFFVMIKSLGDSIWSNIKRIFIRSDNNEENVTRSGVLERESLLKYLWFKIIKLARVIIDMMTKYIQFILYSFFHILSSYMFLNYIYRTLFLSSITFVKIIVIFIMVIFVIIKVLELIDVAKFIHTIIEKRPHITNLNREKRVFANLRVVIIFDCFIFGIVSLLFYVIYAIQQPNKYS